MKTVFRLRHARGKGYVDFDDYSVVLSSRGQHSEWIPFVLKINDHGVVQSERELAKEEINSDRLWMIKKGFEE